MVDGIHGDGALRDIENRAAPIGKETDGHGGIGGARFIVVGSDFRTIAPLLWRRVAWVDRKICGGHVFEQAFDLFGFPSKLSGVGEVLVLTTTALAKEWAEWLDAVG